MVLEAIEDYRRGWKEGRPGLGDERVARGSYAIEHVMPRKWLAHWPLDGHDEAERDRYIHTLGNLTLLTGKDAPPLDSLLDELAESHPGLEIDVQEGGQPHYPLLLSAE